MLVNLDVFLLGRIEELEGVDLDDDGQPRHLFGREALPDDLVHEKDAGLGMVHKPVDVAGFEFMQDGHGHGAVGQGRKETDAPVGLVPGTDGHFVTFEKPALLEHDVQFGDAPGHLPVRQRDTLVIGQGAAVPVFLETVLENLVD